jgi:hypothetical protein
MEEVLGAEIRNFGMEDTVNAVHGIHMADLSASR